MTFEGEKPVSRWRPEGNRSDANARAFDGGQNVGRSSPLQHWNARYARGVDQTKA
jgi:hypothetical protein